VNNRLIYAPMQGQLQMRSNIMKDEQPRRQLVAALRGRGYSFGEIGRALGVTRQAAHSAFQTQLAGGTPCGRCGQILHRVQPPHGRNGPALCLACLARQPGTPFGQRLRSFRLAAGLTQAELAKATGLAHGTIAKYEIGLGVPKAKTLAKLGRVLGRGLAVSEDRRP
jgi:DNA-binding XRE family transcriptional regulator